MKLKVTTIALFFILGASSWQHATAESFGWQQGFERELTEELSAETGYDPETEKDSETALKRTEFAGNLHCEAVYSRIMDENSADFSDCYGTVKASSCAQSTGSTVLPINLVIIMDSSGSMAAKVHGKTRMAIAQNAATTFVKGLKPDINLALMLYGHKGSNQKKDKELSCRGIETVYSFQQLNPTLVTARIERMQPVGYTPIGASLDQAGELFADFPAEKNRNIVILISDGKETCGSDPISKAKQLHVSLSHATINVIGLDVGGEVEEQLHAIATAGEGKYYSARTSRELNTVLANLAKQECTMDTDEKVLEAFLSTELNMLDCKNKLIYEKNASLTEIGLVDNRTCRQYTYSRYKQRYLSIKKHLKEIYITGVTKMEKSYGKNARTDDFQQFFDGESNDFPPLEEIAR